ncbi:type II toxin-antitoxin system death-on-curing family toxin [Rhodococcus sp. UFZ-B548]|uniref:type II toxin-antitoxin system death-on-curing family toxin n=1 Tax=Rhodococcus sp. UFZ-B548 TaxID=2742212 RepID=UPI0015F6ED09|nr:type II toxin-antitoxin system death-on-curing family toxin [Rhodococcus sp. UFZ-B548]
MIETNRFLEGASHVILDRGKLEAALARPVAEYAGVAAFPTMHGRAAALLHGLATAHAFGNANKRTAWISCNIFLSAFDVQLREMSKYEAGGFVEAMILRYYTVEEATIWLLDNSI